jgi:hypothetical protein
MIQTLLARLVAWWQSCVRPEPDVPVRFTVECWCGWQTRPGASRQVLRAFDAHTHDDGSATLPTKLTKMPTQNEEG